jgi:hypothetical protein
VDEPESVGVPFDPKIHAPPNNSAGVLRIKECNMKPTPETIPIERYVAIDLHKEYVMVGGMNAQREWTLRPRRVQMTRFRSWARKNLQPSDAVVIETTGNVWDIYDIVAPLVKETKVAHAGKVRQIAEARVKTDKEDVKRLITLLIGNIVPEVWVPPMPVRELRSLISFRWRLGKQITTLAPAQTAGAVQVCPKIVCTASSSASISIRQKGVC